MKKLKEYDCKICKKDKLFILFKEIEQIRLKGLGYACPKCGTIFHVTNPKYLKLWFISKDTIKKYNPKFDGTMFNVPYLEEKS